MAARTPLYTRHVAAGARMVEFGGFDMPLQYTTIRDEHIAVRTRCGLFDLSHMGEVRFTEWTRENRLRHPSWRGLRPDQDPSAVAREP